MGGWSAVKTLLVINVAMFVLCNLGKFGARVEGYSALSCEDIRHFELWRLFTYMFTHVDFWHIFGNMWSLLIFGGLVERAIGKQRMFGLYVFSGLIGAVTWLLSNWWLEIPSMCIGASGATFGIMLAAALAFPDVKLQLLFPPVTLKMRTLIICLGVYEILMEFSIDSNVAHIAHLGGMLGGFLFMHQLCPSRWPFSLVQWFKKLFRRQGGVRTFPGGTAQGSEGRKRPELDSAEVDRVLDKLSRTGRSSLTPEEMAILEEASRRLKDE